MQIFVLDAIEGTDGTVEASPQGSQSLEGGKAELSGTPGVAVAVLTWMSS